MSCLVSIIVGQIRMLLQVVDSRDAVLGLDSWVKKYRSVEMTLKFRRATKCGSEAGLHIEVWIATQQLAAMSP